MVEDLVIQKLGPPQKGMITSSSKIELRPLNHGMVVRIKPSYILGEQGNFTYLSHLLILLPIPVPFAPLLIVLLEA